MARRVRYRVRQVANLLNLTTPLGLVLGVGFGARPSRGPDGLVLATGYRLGFPPAGAFTIGNVVITQKSRDELLAQPRLLAHETRHATQYAACLGIPMLPLYLLASAWSWLRCRDFARRNVFECRAGLADGGYETAQTG